MKKDRKSCRKVRTFCGDAHPYNHYGQMARSINISSMKIQGKHNAQSTSTLLPRKSNCTINGIVQSTQASTSYIISSKQRASLQSKTTLKYVMNDLIDENLHIQTKEFSQETDQIYQKHYRNRQLHVQNDKLWTQTKVFKAILQQLNVKIKTLETQNLILKQSQKRLDDFIAETNIRNKQTENIQSPPQQQNLQLKVLNLEKRIQTLNFIIRQYRNNKNQEIKEFQRKVNAYRPNYQQELTQKLLQKSQKLEKNEKQLQFSKLKCLKDSNSLGANWNTLVVDIKEDREKTGEMQKHLSELNQKIALLQSKQHKSILKIQETERLHEEISEKSSYVEQLQQQLHKLKVSHDQKEQRLQEALRQLEEITFKMQSLKVLENKIQLKDQAIHRNSIIINKLQIENLTLKTKFETVRSNFHDRVFEEKELKETIRVKSESVQQLVSRISENLTQLGLEIESKDRNTQKCNFLEHLFLRMTNTYDGMLEQYESQLELSSTECKQWYSTLQGIVKINQIREKLMKENEKQLNYINEKKARCLQTQLKIEQNSSCDSCVHWLSHWGQLNALYDQITVILGKVIENVNNPKEN